MATVALIRPGCTDYDTQQRLLGALEMPMNKRGMEQVQEAVRQIQREGLRLEVIYAAPLEPAISTAVAIGRALDDVKVKELDELRNVNQGLWQGLPEADVRRRYPRVFRLGREKPQSICPPEGETLADACRRLTKVINKAIRKHHVFAIVASEPMATVIRCTLQQRGTSVDACLKGEECSAAVECFDTNEFDAGAFVNSDPESDASGAASAAITQESPAK
ncbi:MAG: histidine phosphatase family protein [Planctomycetaceae bacterium]